jgi:hypothetical protein
MTCRHPSRMVQAPTELNQQFSMWSTWRVNISGLFFLFLCPSFFPIVLLEHSFCATFFQGNIIVDVQMGACKNNHIVIRKRKNQVYLLKKDVLLPLLF